MILGKRKKPRMIDVRDLQRRGLVKSPKQKREIPSTKEGFVELNALSKQKESPQEMSNMEFFKFNTTPKKPTTDHNLPTTDQPGGYSKREVDAKITSLDNKIYKLEQRLELIEKKLDINQSSNNFGAMGW